MPANVQPGGAEAANDLVAAVVTDDIVAAEILD